MADTMNTTIEFLDAVKARHSLPSDYALAKKLDVSQQCVSRWRIGKDTIGDLAAIKVAKLLEMDQRYVVACAHAERAKQDDERALWQGFAALLPQPAAKRLCIMLSRVGGKTLPFDPFSLFGQLSAPS